MVEIFKADPGQNDTFDKQLRRIFEPTSIIDSQMKKLIQGLPGQRKCLFGLFRKGLEIDEIATRAKQLAVLYDLKQVLLNIKNGNGADAEGHLHSLLYGLCSVKKRDCGTCPAKKFDICKASGAPEPRNKQEAAQTLYALMDDYMPAVSRLAYLFEQIGLD